MSIRNFHLYNLVKYSFLLKNPKDLFYLITKNKKSMLNSNSFLDAKGTGYYLCKWQLNKCTCYSQLNRKYQYHQYAELFN